MLSCEKMRPVINHSVGYLLEILKEIKVASMLKEN